MSNEPSSARERVAGGPARRADVLHALPWLWLCSSAAWAVVIFVTGQVAWPLAVWIATTVGPLTARRTRHDPNTDPRRSNR